MNKKFSKSGNDSTFLRNFNWVQQKKRRVLRSWIWCFFFFFDWGWRSCRGLGHKGWSKQTPCSFCCTTAVSAFRDYAANVLVCRGVCVCIKRDAFRLSQIILFKAPVPLYVHVAHIWKNMSSQNTVFRAKYECIYTSAQFIMLHKLVRFI